MKKVYGKFGKYYDLIYSSFYDYELECDNLEGMFKKFCKSRPKEILDIGCGTGSHAIELAKRGYKLTGIDISKVMIEEAMRKAQNTELNIDFRVLDMRSMNLDSKFDVAICLFGGFGYLLTNEDLKGFFKGLKRLLAKDSLFVFEFWNVKEVKPGFRSWIKAEDKKKDTKLIRLSDSRFDTKSKILTLSMEFFVFDKTKLLDSFTEAHKLRCFDVLEVEKLLKDYNFNLIATYKKDVSTNIIESDLSNAFNIFAVATSI
jgi:SAM-dependent methyltransferase